VIPVGADGAPFRDQPPQPRPAGAPIRILYCGNLGRMHDTETVVAAVQAGLPASIVLAFRGNGPGFPVLRESLKGTPQVEIGPNLPEAEWVSAMRETDGALVTMRRGAEGLVMPSKTYSAMVAGQAILAVCPLNSDLADLVLKHDAGWVIVPGDASGLTQLIQRIAESPEEVFAKRCNAWRAGHEFYDQRVLAKDWVRVLEELRAQSAG
jgi:glycosyltransferase involved in cell wall biosynthesis